MADFEIGQDDGAPSVTAVLYGDDGAAINLVGCTVKFNMGLPGALTPIVSAPCSILQVGDGSDGSRGQVRYDWQGTDTSVPADYLSEFQITLPSGRALTVPNGKKFAFTVTKGVG